MGKEFDYSDIENLKIDTLTTDDEKRKEKIAKADLLVSWIESHKVFLEFDLLEALSLYDQYGSVRKGTMEKIIKINDILQHKYLNEKIVCNDRNKMSEYVNSLIKKASTDSSLWNKIVIYTKVLECLPMCNRITLNMKVDEEKIKKFIEQTKPLVHLMNQGDNYFMQVSANNDNRTQFSLYQKAIACYKKLGEYKIDCSRKIEKCNRELTFLRMNLCHEADNYANWASDKHLKDINQKINYYESAIECYQIAMDIETSSELRIKYRKVEEQYNRLTGKKHRRENFKEGLNTFFSIVGVMVDDLFDDSVVPKTKEQLERYEREVRPYREKGDECFNKAVELMPSSLFSIWCDKSYLERLREAKGLLESACKNYNYPFTYDEQRDDIKACTKKIIFLGECFTYMANEFAKNKPWFLKNDEVYNIYVDALECYHLATLEGAYCRDKERECEIDMENFEENVNMR